jgi:hypothetical protein
MRRLKPDPVPNELIRKILEACVRAPSGGNMGRCRFLVIRDATVKQAVGVLLQTRMGRVAPRYQAGEPAPGMSRERFLRLLDAAEYLAAHIHEAPVWIVPCLEGATPTRASGSSIYPAVLSMLLAALKGDRGSPGRSGGSGRNARPRLPQSLCDTVGVGFGWVDDPAPPKDTCPSAAMAGSYWCRAGAKKPRSARW